MLRSYMYSATTKIDQIGDTFSSLFYDKLGIHDPYISDTCKILESKIFGSSGMKNLLIHITYATMNIVDKVDDIFSKISIKLHCSISKRNVSILLFKNGTIRLSAGLNDIQSNADFLMILKTHSNYIKSFLGLDYNLDFSVNIINSSFDICIPNIYAFARSSADKWAKITYPDLNKRGRFNVVKFYPIEGKKFHVAIDNRGKAQIFGSSNISESKTLMNMITSCS